MIKAEPGDRIIITNRELTDMYGNIYTVVPHRMLSAKDDGTWPNGVWFAHTYSDFVYYVEHKDYEIVSATRSFSPTLKEEIGQISDSGICPDCKGTGRIKLLTSIVDCDCVKNTARRLGEALENTARHFNKETVCQNCSYEFCECDGTCLKDDGDSCCRCKTWICSTCLMDGMCGSCYAKLQGGVV